MSGCDEGAKDSGCGFAAHTGARLGVCDALAVMDVEAIFVRAAGAGRGGKMPSFHIDLYSGRGKSEVEYLHGAVVRAGEKFGVATPVNKVLTETLMKLTNKEIPLEEFAHQPEKLLALI